MVGYGKGDSLPGEVEALRWYDVTAARPGPALNLAGLLAPDGRTLAERTAAGLRLWDTASSRPRATLPIKMEKSLVLAFSSDGKTLASATSDQDTLLWDTSTGKQRGSLKGRTGEVKRLLFSPDGRFLLTVPEMESARLWISETGRLQAELIYLRWPTYEVVPFVPDSREKIAFAPDGRSLIAHEILPSAPRGKRLRNGTRLCRLDLVRGNQLESVEPGFGLVAVSRDGNTILTADWQSDSRTEMSRLRVWDWAPFWQGRPIFPRLRLIGWLSAFAALGLLLVDRCLWAKSLPKNASGKAGPKLGLVQHR